MTRASMTMCRVLIGFAVALIGIAAFPDSTAAICTFAAASVEERVAASDVVLHGSVVSFDDRGMATVQIYGVWKGSVHGRVHVVSSPSNPYRVFWETGAAYLIYGWHDGDTIHTDFCRGTTLLEDGQADRAALGRPQRPATPLVPLAMGLMTGVTLLLVALRPPRSRAFGDAG